MLPPLIVQSALEKGIQVLAITDHNASANIVSVQQAAIDHYITVIPGVELHTREDIHVLCLFEGLPQVYEFQDFIDNHLPDRDNSPDLFGMQILVDQEGEFTSVENRLLLTATTLSLTSACEKVQSLCGLFIPAHVNRKAYGLIETLGFVPEDLGVDALEITSTISRLEAIKKYPQIASFTLVRNGDAHRLDEILGLNSFLIEAPTFSEIRKGLNGADGRSMTILDR